MSRLSCCLVTVAVLLGTSAAHAELPNAQIGRLPSALPGVALAWDQAPRVRAPRPLMFARQALTPKRQLNESEKDARAAVGQLRDLWSQVQVKLGRNKLQLSVKAAF